MPLLQHPNLVGPDDRDLLWRYLDFPAFASMMLQGRLRFSRMDTFPDRWEGLVRRVEERALRSANGTETIGRTRSVIGDLDAPERRESVALCWCRSEFENAMLWDRYGSQGLAVAIVTTARRLRSLLEASSWKIWFGSVQYVDVRGFDLTPNGVPERLFLKDRSYAAEAEVRAVRHTPGADVSVEGAVMDAAIQSGLFTIKVCIHPAAPGWFGRLVKETMNRCGYDFEIEQSTLGAPLRAHSIEIGGATSNPFP